MPSTIAYDFLVSADEPAFGPGRSLQAIAVSWARLAWDSVWAAGQLAAAIDTLRGRPIRWRRFLTGLAQAPHLFVTWMAVSLPFDALSLLPSSMGGASASAFEAVGIATVIYVMARTALSAPLIVDARRPIGESLERSIAATRGHVSKFVALWLILGLSVLPLAVVDGIVFDVSWHLCPAALGAVYVLSVAQMYLLLTDAAAAANPPTASGA